MDRTLDQNRSFPALRARSDGSSTAEVFMARSTGMTYMDLPVCTVADGKRIVTEIDVGDIADSLGPPTHYFISSTDQCWLLNAEALAKIQSRTDSEVPPAHDSLPKSFYNPPGPAAGRFASSATSQ